MSELLDILKEIFDLLNEMSPYLLFGFLLAGLMHAFIPGSLYSRYLATNDFRSVIYAALFGIPLPLCSCGVIPTAMSLRREGASKGAAVSFLIATPQTGVDSIIATYSLMGLPFAIVRPIAALVTAVFGGQMVNTALKSEGQNMEREEKAERTRKCEKREKSNFLGKIKEALSYAFLEMMEDIGKWLVVGLVVAALITILVPDSFFAIFKGNTLMSMLLVLCIAIPMYICATGSIPIAVALMMKGLTPGAALVLLMAGPACNVASMLVVNKVLGRKTLITYLISIITGSIIFGICIDQLLPAEWFLPKMMSATGTACCHEESASWFSIGCTILLFLLLLNALWHRMHGHSHCHCHEHGHEGCGCGCHDHDEEGCHCHEEEGECCHCHEHAHEEEERVLEFIIKGMNCNHCRNNAQKALESLSGVTEADVDLSSGKAWVKGETGMEEICDAINSLGFHVEKL